MVHTWWSYSKQRKIREINTSSPGFKLQDEFTDKSPRLNQDSHQGTTIFHQGKAKKCKKQRALRTTTTRRIILPSEKSFSAHLHFTQAPFVFRIKEIRN